MRSSMLAALALRGSFLAVSSLLLSACAHGSASGESNQHFRLRDVDVRPRLLGCALYTPPVSRSSRDRYVQTEFDVDAIGRVIPGSVRMVGTHGGHLSGEISNDVVRIAESCAYQPARRKGDPVRVRGVRRTFIIET